MPANPTKILKKHPQKGNPANPKTSGFAAENGWNCNTCGNPSSLKKVLSLITSRKESRWWLFPNPFEKSAHRQIGSWNPSFVAGVKIPLKKSLSCHHPGILGTRHLQLFFDISGLSNRFVANMHCTPLQESVTNLSLSTQRRVALKRKKFNKKSWVVSFTGWWFQPIWKILVKMGIFPK